MKLAVAIMLMVLPFFAMAADDEEIQTPEQADVLAAIAISSAARAAISEIWKQSGEFPSDREATGMSAAATDTAFGPVESLHVFSGVLVVTFGDKAAGQLAGKSLVLAPEITADATLDSVCGAAPPAEADELDLDPVPDNTLPEGCARTSSAN